MANGTAVRLPFPEPAAAAPTEVDPVTIPAKELGIAVFDAVTVFSVAMSDCQHRGTLAPATKDVGSRRLARLSMLQLGHAGGDADFVARAREAGMRELRQHFSADFPHPPAAVEVALAGLINDVLMIVGKAVALERSLAN